MKTILLTATYLVGIGELVLAIFFWMTHSKSEIRKVMALLNFSIAMWVIFSAILAYRDFFPTARLVISLIHFFGLLLLFFLIHVVVVFPYPLFQIDNKHRILFYFPFVIFAYLTFFTRTIVNDFSLTTSSTGMIIGGEVFSFFNGIIIFLYALAVAILMFRIKKFNGFHKYISVFLLASIFFGGLPAIAVDVIIPLFKPGYYTNTLLGVFSTAAWLGLTTFIVAKKK